MQKQMYPGFELEYGSFFEQDRELGVSKLQVLTLEKNQGVGMYLQLVEREKKLLKKKDASLMRWTDMTKSQVER